VSLSLKQRRFADEYAVDHNGAQAAIRAGYSEKTAKEQASRLLTNVHVQAYVAAKDTKTAEKVELTREMVVTGLLEIARNGQVESARVRSWELLGKHLAMFTDRLEVSQIPDPELVRGWIEALEADVNAAP
jgi:phage terminase small subunit